MKYKIKKKEQATSNYNKDIIGVAVIFIGLLIGLGMYVDKAGLFGKFITEIFGGLFGIASLILPILVIAIGTSLIKEDEITIDKRLIYLINIFFGLSCMIHLYYHKILYSTDLTFLENVKTFYVSGQVGKGGGIIGGFVTQPLITVFGAIGCLIILLCFMIINVLLITNIKPKNIMQFFKDVMSDKVEQQAKKASERKTKAKIEKVKKELEIAEEKVQEPEKTIFDINKNEETIKNNVKETPREDDNFSKEQEKQKDNKKVVLNIEHSQIENKEENTYKYPSIELLQQPKEGVKDRRKELQETATKLEKTLKSFGVEAKVTNVSRGPAVTRFELTPDIGVKVSKIVGLSDDIALNLAASSIRIEAPIPGKAAVGIEIPNAKVEAVYLREILQSDKFTEFESSLAFGVGKDISGSTVIADIGKMPHLLIAGATGSGKSVCINTLITSLLYKAKPSEVKLLMIDPKVVELGVYNGIPHLLIPVVTDPKKAAGALNWAVQEMVNRYNLFAKKGVRDLKGYNMALREEGAEGLLPQIVIIIDELADLMMVAPNDVEDAICRLAQMARAAGMHLVIATQRPSVDVITGIIKANIPSRVSFAVTSQVDSRTILDMAGAEKLLGRGDMLFFPIGESKPIRVQGAFVSDKEVEHIVSFVKSNFETKYDEDIMEVIQKEGIKAETDAGDNDELLPQVIDMIVESGQASASLIQRRFKVGYARAARIIDQVEARGIISGYDGSKPRQVLVSKEEWFEMKVK